MNPAAEGSTGQEPSVKTRTCDGCGKRSSTPGDTCPSCGGSFPARRRRISPKLASLFVVPLILLVNVVLFEPWKAGIYTAIEVIRAWPELGHRRALRDEVERVIEAQDRYFALHKRSTNNPIELGIDADGIELTIVASWGGGWSALGTHEGLPPTMQCGVFDMMDSSLRPRLPGRIEIRRPREVLCNWDYQARRQMKR